MGKRLIPTLKSAKKSLFLIPGRGGRAVECGGLETQNRMFVNVLYCQEIICFQAFIKIDVLICSPQNPTVFYFGGQFRGQTITPVFITVAL
jgi:hypothetical protein